MQWDDDRVVFCVLFLVTLTPFLIYEFGRADLFGADPYYFLDAVCNGSEFNTPLLAHDLIVKIPCNITLIKFAMWACCFASTLAIASIGQHYHKNGWRAGFLVFLMPVWFFNFVRFENDVFAMPFIFLAAALFIRDKDLSRWLAVAMLVIAGLFWEGTAIFVVGLALAGLPLLALALPILLLKASSFINAVVPDLGVAENTFGVTLPLLMLGLLGFYKSDKKYYPQLVFFVVLGMINPKWLIFVVPFLIGGLVCAVEGFEWKRKRWFYCLCIVLIVGQAVVLTRGIPTTTQTQAVKDAIELSDGQMQNDWDFGHWVVFYGGDTNSRFHHSWQREWQAGIVLTKHFLPSCSLVNAYGDVNIYRC